MKSKGFTLTEILAVVVILAIMVVIAVPNITGIGTKSKTKMFCTKVKNLEQAAQLYGEEHMDEVDSKSSKTITKKVQDLVEAGFFKKENDTCTYNSTTNPCVTDPRDKLSIDNYNIKIIKKNKRITAEFQYKNNDDKNACANS